MELRSIGVYLCIGISILCVAPTYSYEPKGFTDKKCNLSEDCKGDLSACELIQCDCPAGDSTRCSEVNRCFPSCTLQWLNATSCCDYVPEQFHYISISHVLHIERYVYHTKNFKEFVKIMVWSTHSGRSNWKLLRINLINVYNDSGFWIPSTLAISNSMDYSGVNSEEEGESVLDSIVETVPVHTNLEDGLAEFVNQSGPCNISLICDEHVRATCDCYQCQTLSDSSSLSSSDHNYTNTKDGWYITEVGNKKAGKIGISSELSALHSYENSINQWEEGTFGGWAPAANDTNMFMAFHELKANICGIAIQGMAASTFRSLDKFTVNHDNTPLKDNMDKTIVYKSGVLLHSTSSHFFPEPITEGCLQINIEEPSNATRVGFRAGLIACDSQTPHCQNPDVCTLVDKIVDQFEDQRDDFEQISGDPASASVVIFEVINEILTGGDIPEGKFQQKVVLGTVEVNLEGAESDELQHEGYSFSTVDPSSDDEDSSEDDDNNNQKPTIDIQIPSNAFDDIPENVTVILVISIATPNATANNGTRHHVTVENDPSISSNSKFFLGSPIIQINTYVNGSLYDLTEFHYTVGYKNITADGPRCAYFQEKEVDESNTIKWKFEGCHTDNEEAILLTANCSCNHTTSFSVLLQIHDKSDDESLWDDISSLVTTVCLALSIAALLCALLIYFVLRSTISSARYAIHSNLMVALLLVAIIFLTLIDKTESTGLCHFIMYLMQYLFSASFCWMFAEAIHLYRQIITVFESERKHTWIYFAVGWGLPLLFVAISMCFTIKRPIIGDICFFSVVDDSIWLVVVPVLVIIVINLCVLVRVTLVVVKAVKFQAEKDSSEKAMQVKAGIRSALLLMPLMGSPYLLFPLVGTHGAIKIAYDIINSLQGFFVALFYCAMNSEVRNAISQYIRRSKDASTIQGSTTGLKESSKSSKSKGLFTKKNKVGATQFTFTSGSQSKLGSSSTDDLAPIS